MQSGKAKAVVMVILLAVFMSGCAKTEAEAQQKETVKIPVRVETVEKGALEKVISLGGLLAPHEEVMLAAKNPALRIARVACRVGDEVAAGTPLVVFDSRDLNLQLEQARLNYERSLELFESGALPKSQLEQAEYTLRNLEIQWESMSLTSPIRGIVSKVEAVEGQLAGSMPLVSVVNIEKLKLKIQVGEANIAKLAAGGLMPVTVPAAAGVFTGTVTAVAPQIDPVSKAYPVTLEITNEEQVLRGGMYGEVQLVVESKQDIVAVPQQAILTAEQQDIVYIVENGVARKREVEVGLTLGDKAEIVSGLAPGEQLIVEGQYAVTDGTAVSITLRGETE